MQLLSFARTVVKAVQKKTMPVLPGVMTAAITAAASSPWWWPQEVSGRYKELGGKKHEETRYRKGERTEAEEGRLIPKGEKHFPTDPYAGSVFIAKWSTTGIFKKKY